MSIILLIEDDLTLRRALRLSLEKIGHEVIEVGDGHAGLAALSRTSVDLVVTDMIMPGMEGMETIRTLKIRNPNLPVIAISGGGRGFPEDYLRVAHALGARKTFAKPFDVNSLCQAVQELLGENENPPMEQVID